MFLVEDRRHGTTYLVFTSEDPRKDGYKGQVIDGVSLDYDLSAVHSWPKGQARPEACVGRDADNPKHYKVFKYSSERQSAEYQPVAGTPLVFVSWPEYVKLNPYPEDLEKLDEENWYERLDEYDEASRRRRQRCKSRIGRRAQVETKWPIGWRKNTSLLIAAFGKCGTCREERRPMKFVYLSSTTASLALYRRPMRLTSVSTLTERASACSSPTSPARNSNRSSATPLVCRGGGR